jgi:hypothetical protein
MLGDFVEVVLGDVLREDVVVLVRDGPRFARQKLAFLQYKRIWIMTPTNSTLRQILLVA